MEEFRRETLKPNVLVVGTTGAGKSSLINTIFGEKVAQEGTGKPVTTHFNRYEPDTLPVVIYDSKGLEHGNTAEFITSTEQFFEDVGASLQDTIHVVWYVINGPGSRIQPFEEEIWKSLFKDIPILFIINKGDIATDSDRAMIRETINGHNLVSCKGIFDMVSGTREPVLNVTNCAKCGSDDIEVRKRKRTATCAACGHTFSIQATNEELIKTTLKILPDKAREAFISAQSTSCSHKDLRAKLIMHEYARNAKGPGGGGVLSEMTKVLVRLASMWNFQRYGMSVSHTIVDTMFKRAISLSKVKGLVLKFGGSSDATLLEHTIPVVVIWNRCLRKLFILTSFEVIKGRELSQKDLTVIIAESFDSLNQEEHAEVLNFFVANGLEALLSREMPECAAQGADPIVPPPFTTHSPGAQSLLPNGPVKVRKALDVPEQSTASLSCSPSMTATGVTQQQQQQQQQGPPTPLGSSPTVMMPSGMTQLSSSSQSSSPSSSSSLSSSTSHLSQLGNCSSPASLSASQTKKCDSSSPQKATQVGDTSANVNTDINSNTNTNMNTNMNTNTNANINTNTNNSTIPLNITHTDSNTTTLPSSPNSINNIPPISNPSGTSLVTSSSSPSPSLHKSSDSVHNDKFPAASAASPPLPSPSPSSSPSGSATVPIPPVSSSSSSSLSATAAISASIPHPSPSLSSGSAGQATQIHLSPPLHPVFRSGTSTPGASITLGSTKVGCDVMSTKARTSSHSESTLKPPLFRNGNGSVQSFSPPPHSSSSVTSSVMSSIEPRRCGSGAPSLSSSSAATTAAAAATATGILSPMRQDESPTAAAAARDENDTDSKSSGDDIKLDQKEIERIAKEELDRNKEEKKDLKKNISEALKGNKGATSSPSSRRSLDIAQPPAMVGGGSMQYGVVRRENSQGALCYASLNNTHKI